MNRARRILAVDDGEVVRKFLVEILQWLGHEAEAVSSGEEGLAAFDEVRHALLITDHCMPGMSGAELIRRLQGRCLTLPAVAVTATDADRAKRIRPCRFGASGPAG